MRFIILLSLFLFSLPAFAVEPDEILPDPEMEARAREISKDLRCLVCQNQSIDDSNAGLARDLRILVRDRIKAGDSDAEAVAYIVNRYGDFVLLNPPMKPETWMLWYGPPIILLLAAIGAAFYLRRRAGSGEQPVEPLSESERARLERILGDGDRG